jgi:hypothetical protein
MGMGLQINRDLTPFDRHLNLFDDSVLMSRWRLSP